MLEIKHVLIKNFRPIVNLSLEVKSLNIFVGLNDVGKSNVLKALNLFFNGKTELDHDFHFETDYSNLAPERVKKAKEVIIQVTFRIPDNYKDRGELTWKKVWREEGLYEDGEKSWNISKYSKVTTLLHRIKYKYVPAVKSNDYFRSLLTDLYLSIAKEANTDLESKASAYSDALKEFTHRIGDIVKSNIGIESALEMPTNQGDIFKELIFNTQDQSGKKINLSFRGDGIKAMHIPAILKYISEQDAKTLSANSIPYTTIWGYEEPENGIEMLKCFEVAKQFLDYSSSIQLFVSTHSPSFYCLDDSQEARVFFAWKDEDTFETLINNSVNNRHIDDAVGLMPIVAPYIKEAQLAIQKYQEIIDQGVLQNVDTIFVEGITDKHYLELGIKEFSQGLQSKLDQRELLIITRPEGCGTSLLCDWAIAWLHMGFSAKAYVLLDHDEAGIKAKSTIKSINDDYSRIRRFNLKSKFWDPNEVVSHIINSLPSAGRKNYQYEVEHLLSLDFWLRHIPSGSRSEKPYTELSGMFESCLSKSKTVDALILDLNLPIEIKNSILSWNVKDEKKVSICSKVQTLCNEGKGLVISGLRKTVESLEAYFLSPT